MKNIFRCLAGLLLLIVFISIYFFTNKLQPMSAEVKARTVIDSVGCEVVILIHPHRVVILNLSNLEIYYATGGAIVTTGAV